MWEFGMDGGHFDVTEFKNRQFTLPALDDDGVQPESLLSRTALQINATTICISAAQTILECFVAIPIEKLSKAPNLTFVRAVYALVALMRADYAVGTDPDMEELLESQSLRVDYFLKTVVQRTSEAIGPQCCRIPSHWTFVVKEKLKNLVGRIPGVAEKGATVETPKDQQRQRQRHDNQRSDTNIRYAKGTGSTLDISASV